jgi:hypothetical protein
MDLTAQLTEVVKTLAGMTTLAESDGVLDYGTRVALDTASLHIFGEINKGIGMNGADLIRAAFALGKASARFDVAAGDTAFASAPRRQDRAKSGSNGLGAARDNCRQYREVCRELADALYRMVLEA